MTVGELREHLESFNDDSPLFVKTDVGKFFTLKNIAVSTDHGFIVVGEEVFGDC